MASLREAGIPAHGLVVESSPEDAVRDAFGMLDPKPTDVILSTHPVEKSGWLRKNVVDKVRNAAGDVPVEHIVVEVGEEGGPTNVLVIANETVVGDALLARIRERAARGPTSFLIISPQSDPSQSSHPEADRRLRRALSELRGAGIEAHGQVAHPIRSGDAGDRGRAGRRGHRLDLRADESPWLRKNLVQRLESDAGVPVEHVVISAEEVGAEPAQT